jgi:hypothetical protein
MYQRKQIRNAALFAATIVFTLPVFAAAGSLPPGTKLQVRVTDRMTSESAKPGDTFHGTLAQPVVVNGRTVFDKGAGVSGQVMQASSSGRLSSPGELQLVLTSVSTGWFRCSPVTVQPLVVSGGSHTKSNLGKIGGGAAAGAIVGGIAAGGKGAAIGAGVGAGAGTAVAAATGKREAVVETEALLTWTTIRNQPAGPATSSRLATNNYRDDRDEHDRDDSHYAKPHDRGHHDDDEDEDNNRSRDRDDRGGYDRFSDHDRSVLEACLTGGEDYSNLPPGLAKRDRLPPGLEKQLQRNGTLPPGLQKRIQPLPEQCDARLPRLPHDWERVILSGRIILLDQAQRILDILDLHD